MHCFSLCITDQSHDTHYGQRLASGIEQKEPKGILVNGGWMYAAQECFNGVEAEGPGQ